MASRAEVLDALERSGPLFTNELLMETGASRELLRLMQLDGVVVRLTPDLKGRHQQIWCGTAYLKRILRDIPAR